MLDRAHLHIVREVHRTGSLTGAAERLCLTQSALSHAVRKIEARLGTRIWRKQGRRLQLTPAGEHLLALAHRILPQFEHAEALLREYAGGRRGIVRIGIECYPCYQWLLNVVSPFLEAWPGVDVDIKQKFRFGGIGALFEHEIDLLITPDPLVRKTLSYTPVFEYEQVLVVHDDHPLAGKSYLTPRDLDPETLLTYPVERERLDIFNRFLLPANHSPARHKLIENTEMMLQMVAAGRGVAALPRWLVDEHAGNLPVRPLRAGRRGIFKHIHIGCRRADEGIDYISAFIAIAGKAEIAAGV